MHRLVILVCALAPSIVFLQYGIAKARLRWNDAMVWEVYFSGGMAALIALLLELLLKKAIAIDTMSPVNGAATEALFIAAIPEELAKLAMLFVAIKRYGGDTKRHDMIILSSRSRSALPRLKISATSCSQATGTSSLSAAPYCRYPCMGLMAWRWARA